MDPTQPFLELYVISQGHGKKLKRSIHIPKNNNSENYTREGNWANFGPTIKVNNSWVQRSSNE